MKVFNEDGSISDDGQEAVFNDLSRAPILDALPTDKPVYYAVAIPADEGKFRLALVMPKVVASVKNLMAQVKTLTDKIESIALTPGPEGKPGKDGADGLPGIKGTDGKDGQPGIAGKDGLPGSNGKDGIAGTNGINGKDGLNGKDGTNGSNGTNGKDGSKGDPGTPTRVERYTSFSTDANGIASIVFSQPFTAIPDCDIVESWTSDAIPRMICGSCYDVTLTGCKAQTMLSQGTLLIGATPFAKAGAGIKPVVRAIGK